MPMAPPKIDRLGATDPPMLPNFSNLKRLVDVAVRLQAEELLHPIDHAKIRKKRRSLKSLTRLSKRISAPEERSEAPDVPPGVWDSMNDIIAVLSSESPKALTEKDIGVLTSASYINKAIHMLMDQGRIKREGNGYRHDPFRYTINLQCPVNCEVEE